METRFLTMVPPLGTITTGVNSTAEILLNLNGRYIQPFEVTQMNNKCVDILCYVYHFSTSFDKLTESRTDCQLNDFCVGTTQMISNCAQY